MNGGKSYEREGQEFFNADALTHFIFKCDTDTAQIEGDTNLNEGMHSRHNGNMY